STGQYRVDGEALATHGVLTRHVRDTALALDVLAQGWPGDDRVLARPAAGSFLTAADADVTPLRIGVLTTPIITPDAPVYAEALGREVTEVPPPFPAENWLPFLDVWSVMAASAPLLPEVEQLLVPLTPWMRERGRGVAGVTYAGAIAAGQRLPREAAQTWAGVDVVLSPTLAQPAPRIGEMRDDDDPEA